MVSSMSLAPIPCVRLYGLLLDFLHHVPWPRAVPERRGAFLHTQSSLPELASWGSAPVEQGTPVQAMPVAMAVFFATRLSFAPVLRMTPFAALPFFDEELDFLRLAFFMDSSHSTRFVEPGPVGAERYVNSQRAVSFRQSKTRLESAGSALHLCHC
jgi:hypothetical protein